MATTTSAPTDTGQRAARARRIAEQIYGDHRHHLLAIADRNSADHLDAEEAMQDAFLLFLGRFDPASGTPPLAWMTLTLKRRCWEIYRRRRAAPDIPSTYILGDIPDQAPSPEEIAEDAEELAVYRSSLRTLRPNQRRALGLLAIGFSYREIMNVTGWSYTKVNRALRDGRSRLRQTH